MLEPIAHAGFIGVFVPVGLLLLGVKLDNPWLFGVGIAIGTLIGTLIYDMVKRSW